MSQKQAPHHTAVEKNMWVPAPPKGGTRGSGRSKRPAPGSSASEAGSRAERGSRGTVVAAILVVLALVALCGVGAAAAAGAVSSAGDGGRTNLLLLGIDRRGGTGWAYRTDTIVVLTVDPATRSAGMLSIPRDLQVPIPGHGEDRINTANFWGSQGGDAEGGPALLEATVESNFGISVDGYLMVDFDTFVRLVDALGGIDVEVPETLHDTRYPNPLPEDPYGVKTVHFDPGSQHMDGTRAIEYARSRMSTSDFDRAKRQQRILIAIRKRASSPSGIVRLPRLAAVVLQGVKTDQGPLDLLRLAILVARIDPAGLRQVVLDHPLVYSYTRADGAAVQLPNWDLINPVIDELFGGR